MTNIPDSDSSKSLATASEDRPSVMAALRAATADAVERHRRLGEPIVVWQDGRIQWQWPQADGTWASGEVPNLAATTKAAS